MAKIISFVNMKGGVGKTTLSVNLGYSLSKGYNYRILLIDFDPQMNASQYILDAKTVNDLFNNPKKTVYSILKPALGFDNCIYHIQDMGKYFCLIPSTMHMLNCDLTESNTHFIKFLHSEFINKHFDLVFLDVPPTLSKYTEIALQASDGYVVPITTGYFSLIGMSLLDMYVGTKIIPINSKLIKYGIILNMVENTKGEAYEKTKYHLDENEKWKNDLLQTEISKTAAAHGNYNSNGMQRIFFHNMLKSKLAREIRKLSSEFNEKIIIRNRLVW